MTKQGRDAEFTAFATSRSNLLRRAAYLLCTDWHRADDLVQETLTKLYVHWGRISGVENPDGYARRVLVNTFLAEQRSPWARWTARLQLRSDIDSPGAPGDPEGSIDIRRALASLPPRQRATLVLRYYLDLSVEQTAEALGCSPGNVKSQTSRGLESLRRLLTPQATTAVERQIA